MSAAEAPGPQARSRSIKHRLVHEAVRFVWIFLYLWVLFGLFVLYGLSGYVFWGYQALRGRANPARSVVRDR